MQIEEILNHCNDAFPIVTPLALQVISKYVSSNDYKTVIDKAACGGKSGKILDFYTLRGGLSLVPPYCNEDIWKEIHMLRTTCVGDPSITTQTLIDKIAELNDINKSKEYFISLSKGESEVYINKKLVKIEFKMDYMIYLLELMEFDKYVDIIDPVLTYHRSQQKSLHDPPTDIDLEIQKYENKIKMLKERKRLLEGRTNNK